MNPTYGSDLFEHCFPLKHYVQILVEVNVTFRLVKDETSRDATIGITSCGLVSYFRSHQFELPLADNHQRREALVHEKFGVGSEEEEERVAFAHFLEGLDDWFIP